MHISYDAIPVASTITRQSSQANNGAAHQWYNRRQRSRVNAEGEKSRRYSTWRTHAAGTPSPVLRAQSIQKHGVLAVHRCPAESGAQLAERGGNRTPESGVGATCRVGTMTYLELFFESREGLNLLDSRPLDSPRPCLLHPPNGRRSVRAGIVGIPAVSHG